MRQVLVYQLNDFMPHVVGKYHHISNYYRSARIPMAELIDTNIVSVAEYLVLASYSSAWEHRRLRPMRPGDLILLTDHRLVIHDVYSLSDGGSIRLPQFTSLSLNPHHLAQEEFYNHERPNLAVSSR